MIKTKHCKEHFVVEVVTKTLKNDSLYDSLQVVSHLVSNQDKEKVIIVINSPLALSPNDRFKVTTAELLSNSFKDDISIAIVSNQNNFHEFFDEVTSISSSCGKRAEHFTDELEALRWLHGVFPPLVSYVAEYASTNLTLKKMTANFGIKESQVHNFIKDWTGEDFYGFRDKVRIIEAKKKVHQGYKHLCLLAKEFGFRNRDQFLRAYRKVTGNASGIWEPTSII